MTTFDSHTTFSSYATGSCQPLARAEPHSPLNWPSSYGCHGHRRTAPAKGFGVGEISSSASTASLPLEALRNEVRLILFIFRDIFGIPAFWSYLLPSLCPSSIPIHHIFAHIFSQSVHVHFFGTFRWISAWGALGFSLLWGFAAVPVWDMWSRKKYEIKKIQVKNFIGKIWGAGSPDYKRESWWWWDDLSFT